MGKVILLLLICVIQIFRTDAAPAKDIQIAESFEDPIIDLTENESINERFEDLVTAGEEMVELILEGSKWPVIVNKEINEYIFSSEDPIMVQADEDEVINNSSDGPIMVQEEEVEVINSSDNPIIVQEEEEDEYVNSSDGLIMVQKEEVEVINSSDGPIMVQEEEVEVINSSDGPIMVQEEEDEVINSSDGPIMVQEEENEVINSSDNPIMVQEEEVEVINSSDGPIMVQEEEVEVINSSDDPIMIQGKEDDVINGSDDQPEPKSEEYSEYYVDNSYLVDSYDFIDEYSLYEEDVSNLKSGVDFREFSQYQFQDNSEPDWTDQVNFRKISLSGIGLENKEYTNMEYDDGWRYSDSDLDYDNHVKEKEYFDHHFHDSDYSIKEDDYSLNSVY